MTRLEEPGVVHVQEGMRSDAAESVLARDGREVGTDLARAAGVGALLRATVKGGADLSGQLVLEVSAGAVGGDAVPRLLHRPGSPCGAGGELRATRMLSELTLAHDGCWPLSERLERASGVGLVVLEVLTQAQALAALLTRAEVLLEAALAASSGCTSSGEEGSGNHLDARGHLEEAAALVLDALVELGEWSLGLERAAPRLEELLRAWAGVVREGVLETRRAVLEPEPGPEEPGGGGSGLAAVRNPGVGDFGGTMFAEALAAGMGAQLADALELVPEGRAVLVGSRERLEGVLRAGGRSTLEAGDEVLDAPGLEALAGPVRETAREALDVLVTEGMDLVTALESCTEL